MNVMFRVAAVALVLFVSACSSTQPSGSSITLATTTSSQDSGLLDELLPAFEKQSGIKVKVVAVGSGQALELGRRGDADVLLTHSPAAEEKFMAEGWGDARQPVMHNDFVIVGPEDDSAQLKSLSSAVAAFQAISQAEQPFVSRGDESGTHQKELAVWKEAALDPSGDWYIKAGAGMAQALRIASERRAYVLADRGTYLAHKRELELVILLQGDPQLINRYSVITISKEKHPHLQHAAGRKFAEFLISQTGQQLISSCGVEKYGEPLFVPDASGTESDAK